MSPGEQYRAVLDDFESARRAASARFEAATSEEGREEVRAKFPGPEDSYGRLLALAEAHPDDPAAVDALAWIVATSANGYDDFKERGVQIRRAMNILVVDALGDPRVGRACLDLGGSATPLRDAFLHDVYAKSTDRRVKGRACLALGELLLAKSGLVAELKGESGESILKRIAAEAPHRLPYLEKLSGEDPAGLARRGEQLLELAIEDYGELPHDPIIYSSKGATLSEVAEADLRRFRDLDVGREAPEIVGQDVDGNGFKLSDYRGRVVLLTFSANWCGPCRALYPSERALVDQFKGRPFAMLSVNADESAGTLRESIAKGEITWRCWWEAGGEGPICGRWMIEGFPQAYLIDREGVIRSRGARDQSALARQIDELIRVSEGEKRGP